MSTILSARYHQGKPQAAVIGRGKRRGQRKYMRGEPPLSQDVLATTQDKSAKQIVSENSDKSVNNRTHADNDTKIDQYSQSSIQVSTERMIIVIKI